MFLEHQISILEWFLKNHVTLKTSSEAENWVGLENSAFPSKEYITF